jgi:flagellar motor switch protein FliG
MAVDLTEAPTAPPPLALAAPAHPPASNLPPISGLRKAAILLTSLGDAETSGVMRLLSLEQVREITREIAQLTRIAAPERTAVFAEFSRHIEAPETSGGPDFATSLLMAAFGPSDGKRMADQVFNSEPPSPTPQLDALREADPKALARVLHREHPQMIAVLLSQLSTPAASEVLTALPGDLRAQVTKRIAALESVSPATVERLAGMVNGRVKVAAKTDTRPCGGTRSVAEMMNRIHPEASEQILTEIGGEDPDLSRDIRNLMFVFEDLLQLSQDNLRMVIGKVDKKALTLALKGCSPKLKAHVTGIMSSRAAEMLSEDMQALGPVRIKDVEEAQKKIVDVVPQLKEQGAIALGAGGESDQFVT